MQPSLSFVLVLLGCLLLGSAHSTDGADWEELYLAALSADSVRAFAQNYTATAHLAGTEEDYQSALYTQDQARPTPSQFAASSIDESRSRCIDFFYKNCLRFGWNPY
jgi:hypothetical protein